ncbi:GreA/GreB family elongation factor [Candidatus Saccharibacteria bacterium]|nr:GreA/GreB family elongation factor [Candidatus Saccharibacteria bacterium]
MTEQGTILLSSKGIKDLRKSISKLEHKQSALISALRDIDKTDTHDQRLIRIEKLSELEYVENELRNKRYILHRAKPLPRKRDALKVVLGSAVELIDISGRIVKYTIVNGIEANPTEGRISADSPLGQSLLGKTLQDTIRWGNNLQIHKMQLIAIK